MGGNYEQKKKKIIIRRDILITQQSPFLSFHHRELSPTFEWFQLRLSCSHQTRSSALLRCQRQTGLYILFKPQGEKYSSSINKFGVNFLFNCGDSANIWLEPCWRKKPSNQAVPSGWHHSCWPREKAPKESHGWLSDLLFNYRLQNAIEKFGCFI